MDVALSSPATARNRAPILAVLAPRLAADARVLEVASGAGEHAVHLAGAMPGVRWRPSDPSAEARASIGAWRAKAGAANVAEPLALDAMAPETWPEETFDALVCINMVHISPWAATQGLMALAAKVLAPEGRLFLYGPYVEAEVETAPSNLAFDESLRARDPAWGLRDLADVAAEAGRRDLVLAERIAMPANNLIVVFARKTGHRIAPPSPDRTSGTSP